MHMIQDKTNKINIYMLYELHFSKITQPPPSILAIASHFPSQLLIFQILNMAKFPWGES